jgi:hypothetical protein
MGRTGGFSELKRNARTESERTRAGFVSNILLYKKDQVFSGASRVDSLLSADTSLANKRARSLSGWNKSKVSWHTH